jgi:hypothetical protein
LRWIAFGVVALSAASATAAYGGRAATPVCEGIRANKAKVYGYHLAQMNEPQIEAKSKELDAFWKEVHGAGSEGVTCLRGLLAEEKTDHVFQFDAASMLFPVDKSPEALTLIRDALVQTDFAESDPANYLELALQLSQAGVDVSPLAAKLLFYPNATIHVTEHSLDLDSDTAALFLYGSMDPAQASNALIDLLKAPEPFVRSAAAHLLAEQMTEESFRALSQWKGMGEIEEEFRRNDIQAIVKCKSVNAENSAYPKFTREQVLETIAGLPHTRKEFDEVMATKGAAFDKQMRDVKATQQQIAQAVAESLPIYGVADHSSFISSAVATLRASDFATIREARRRALDNVSDESLSEYLAYTQIMIGMLNRLDLYKEYRIH